MRQVAPHDHAVFLYDEPREMALALARFTEQGIASNEVVVFVHAFDSESAALEAIKASGYAFEDLINKSVFLVAFYKDAFEGAGLRIDFDHAVEVVNGIIRDAQTRGFNGARVFVDSSRLYLTQGRLREWFEFEERLGRRLQARLGLVCAYHRPTVSTPELRERVLLTHLYRFEP